MLFVDLHVQGGRDESRPYRTIIFYVEDSAGKWQCDKCFRHGQQVGTRFIASAPTLLPPCHRYSQCLFYVYRLEEYVSLLQEGGGRLSIGAIETRAMPHIIFKGLY